MLFMISMERTLILLKPDCVQRRLMGRVISRLEDKGLNFLAMKMLQVTPALARQHYVEHIDKPFYPALEGFITGSPILAAVVEKCLARPMGGMLLPALFGATSVPVAK